MDRYYPAGAVKHRSELKEGETIYSITWPDARDPGAISNTKNLERYTITGIDLSLDHARLEDLSGGTHIITLSYRNLDDSTSEDGAENSWFLFKNFWYAWAYYYQVLDKQEKT